MPKSNKAKDKKSKSSTHTIEKCMVQADDDGQVYGIVEKALGGCYFTVNCFDNKIRRCKNRKKRVRVNVQDIVIVSLREFEEVGDIIHKYEPEEVRRLQNLGVLPSNITSTISTSDLANADDCAFNFDTI
jgi:initiation factor 1A